MWATPNPPSDTVKDLPFYNTDSSHAQADVTPEPQLIHVRLHTTVAVYMMSFFNICSFLFLVAQFIRWFFKLVNWAEYIYKRLVPRYRRRLSKWPPWRPRIEPSPRFSSDTFSFLYYDITNTGEVYTALRLVEILSDVATQQWEADAGRPVRRPWWAYLPWRTVEAVKPRIALSLIGSNPPSDEDGANLIIYGNETWFEAPPADFLTITRPMSSSDCGWQTSSCLQVHLDGLHRNLARRLDAFRNVPRRSTPEELQRRIIEAWDSNPYLLDFEDRYSAAPWGVPLPTNLPTGQWVFKPHYGFVQFWSSAFQIAVDPTAGTAWVQINQDDFEPPEPEDLERTISAFRILHVELLRAGKKAAHREYRSSDAVEKLVHEIFQRAAERGNDALDPILSVKEHWGAVAEWRPATFIKREFILKCQSRIAWVVADRHPAPPEAVVG